MHLLLSGHAKQVTLMRDATNRGNVNLFGFAFRHSCVFFFYSDNVFSSVRMRSRRIQHTLTCSLNIVRNSVQHHLITIASLRESRLLTISWRNSGSNWSSKSTRTSSSMPACIMFVYWSFARPWPMSVNQNGCPCLVMLTDMKPFFILNVPVRKTSIHQQDFGYSARRVVLHVGHYLLGNAGKTQCHEQFRRRRFHHQPRDAR